MLTSLQQNCTELNWSSSKYLCWELRTAGFIAGQLNSTWRRVELRRGSVHSDADATGRRVVEAYTVRQRSTIISERRDPVESICRARRKLWRKLCLHHSFTFLVQEFALLRGLYDYTQGSPTPNANLNPIHRLMTLVKSRNMNVQTWSNLIYL